MFDAGLATYDVPTVPDPRATVRLDLTRQTIGGFAVIAHGFARATVDIDLITVQDEDNPVRLAATFSALHARLRGVDADLLDSDPTDPTVLTVLTSGERFTLDTDAGPVDYLNDVTDALDYARTLAHVVTMTDRFR